MKKAIIGEDPDTASYGYSSVQIKTAAETLGYDSENLTGQERFDIIKTLQDPEMSIYVASKYLSDLRDQQINDVGADNITEDEMIILASQYNRGPGIGLTATGYGQTAIDNMKRIGWVQ